MQRLIWISRDSFVEVVKCEADLIGLLIDRCPVAQCTGVIRIYLQTFVEIGDGLTKQPCLEKCIPDCSTVTTLPQVLG